MTTDAAPARPLRILLADDHPVVRAGLKALLEAQPDMAVVAEAADGLQAVALAAGLDFDLAVVDMSMPGLTGAQVVERLRASHPASRVLILTAHEDAAYARRAVAAGARGFVVKRAAAAALVGAVRAVAAGGMYLDPAVAGAVLSPVMQVAAGGAGDAGPALSDREEAVLRMIAQGFSNVQAAARLGVSVKSVESYKARGMEKLGLRGRVDVVRHGARHGWLADPGTADPAPEN
jgi:DNA-binding NarL/FixJ family response regulator